jgi:hypothetical protein
VNKLDLTKDGFGEAELSAALDLLAEVHLRECEKQFHLAVPNHDLRQHLAYVLWKTLRNRSAEAETPSQTAALLRDAQETAGKLADLISAVTRNQSSDAAFFLFLGSDKVLDSVELERLAAEVRNLAEVAAKARSMTALPSRGQPVQLEKHALLAELDGLAKYYKGDERTAVTRDSANDLFGGDLFLLFKTVENAVAKFKDVDPPEEPALAKFIERRNDKIRRSAAINVGST